MLRHRHKYEKSQIEDVLKKFSESDEYGIIIRAKGMVAGSDGEWIYFDYVPGEYEDQKDMNIQAVFV